MTIKIRQANTGKVLTTYENVRHFHICSTGPRDNTRTMLVSQRYDRDDEFPVTLCEDMFVCVEEE